MTVSRFHILDSSPGALEMALENFASVRVIFFCKFVLDQTTWSCETQFKLFHSQQEPLDVVLVHFSAPLPDFTRLEVCGSVTNLLGRTSVSCRKGGKF